MSAASTPKGTVDQEQRDSSLLISKAIADVLPSSDPFDDPEFDVIAMINRQFPTELSLSTVDTAAERLEDRMTKLDGDILDAVEAQSSTGEAVKKDLEEANLAVVQLTGKLERIRTKSEETENMVREICSDIQTLDNAKRNLTSTITVLRRLHMLETAVEQLSMLTTERAYREAANLLEAVTQLASNFDSYRAIPKICELLSSVRALRSELQAQVFEEFKMHIGDSMSEEVSAMLSDAAQVVTVLGQGLILKLVQWFSDKELAEYCNLFDPAKQSASFEGVELRFAWLKRWFRTYQQNYAPVFPALWKVPQLFSESFCDQTRQHLSVLLQRVAKESSSKGLDVRRLLFVIQQTIGLERELNQRFFPANADGGDGSEEEKEEETAAAAEGKKEEAVKGFDKMISRVFKPYMSLYLKLERAQLEDLVKKQLADEKWGQDAGGTGEEGEEEEEEEDENPVLGSVSKIFVEIKRSLTQCEAVDKGETLLQLSKTFQDTLILYGEGLHKHVLELSRSRSGAKVLSGAEERTVAVIINTCEYTAETAKQLELSVCKAIDHALAPQVVYDSIDECLDSATDSAVGALVASVLGRLDTALAPMTKIKWADTDAVGDTSPYVAAVQEALAQSVPALRETVSTAFFSALCDKWAAGFFPRLQGHILKIKRVSDDAVQQLLLDVNALRTVMLSLPTVGVDTGKAKVSKTFSSLVGAESDKVERLLKVLLSDKDEMEHNFTSLIKNGDKLILQRMLEMKGVAQPKQAFDVVEAGQVFTESTRAAGQAMAETMAGVAGGRLPAISSSGSLQKGFDTMGRAVGSMSSRVGMVGSTVKTLSDSNFKAFATTGTTAPSSGTG